MDKNKNQGQPDQSKKSDQPKQQQNAGQSNPGNEPADNNPSGIKEQSQSGGFQQSQTGSQQSGEWKKPVTNEDEQQKTTNVGKSEDAPLSEEESEGDKRLKPYKNVGDDSEEVEKKTPTME